MNADTMYFVNFWMNFKYRDLFLSHYRMYGNGEITIVNNDNETVVKTNDLGLLILEIQILTTELLNKKGVA